jgi:hypothetical protein
MKILPAVLRTIDVNKIQNMKKLIFAFALLASCSEDDKGPETKCLTGENSTGTRVFIKCLTREQYLAGSNVQAGGSPEWNYYIRHEWEECDNCK